MQMQLHAWRLLCRPQQLRPPLLLLLHHRRQCWTVQTWMRTMIHPEQRRQLQPTVMPQQLLMQQHLQQWQQRSGSPACQLQLLLQRLL
jgi:hypothetical protein